MRVCWDHTRGGRQQGPERLPAAGDHGLGEQREGVPELWAIEHPRGRQGLTTLCLHISATSSSPPLPTLHLRSTDGYSQGTLEVGVGVAM